MNVEALQRLLAERRALIAPEKHGLARPRGKGRRAPGLAQHQIDLLLNRSLGTYQRLESGKYKNPPVDYLRDISLILELSEMEWIALCRYAGIGDPPGPLTSKSGEAVSGIWHEAVNGITHPAFVVDASWNVLARNQPFAEIFPSGDGPSNALKWMIFDGRSLMADWDTAWAPHVLPILRTDLAARPGDCVLRELEEDVLADPRTARLYDVAGIAPRIDENERPLRHAMHGPGWVKVCMAQPAASPGTRLIFLIFRPNDRNSSSLVSSILRDSASLQFEAA